MTYNNPTITIGEKQFVFTPEMFSYNRETGALHIKSRTVTTLLDVKTPELRKERHAQLVKGLGLKFRNVSLITGVGIHNQGTVRIAGFKNFEPMTSEKKEETPKPKEEDKGTDKPEKPTIPTKEDIVYGQNWNWSQGTQPTPMKLKKEQVTIPEGTWEELFPVKPRKYKLTIPNPEERKKKRLEFPWPEVIIFCFLVF